MPTTTNYGWTTPADTDLVKDGASAIRTLGSSVDTTVKALNPETTLGDIAYRSSTANTNTRLAIGTSGQVLTVSGGVPAWTSPTAAKVIQVVYGSTGTSATTTSTTTYADTNLTATITPTSASNNILVFVSQNGIYKQTDNNGIDVTLVRGSTEICFFADRYGYNNSTSVRAVLGASASYLDSPATTSATTYKTQFRSDGTGTATVQQNGEKSTIVLMEVTP
jgi:hypothetical protein